MRSFLQDMGFTEISIDVTEATGHQLYNPYSLTGVGRNFLDVVYEDQIVITEHSKEYELEMAMRNQTVKRVQGGEQVDIVEAMHIEYEHSSPNITSSD